MNDRPNEAEGKKKVQRNVPVPSWRGLRRSPEERKAKPYNGNKNATNESSGVNDPDDAHTEYQGGTLKRGLQRSASELKAKEQGRRDRRQIVTSIQQQQNSNAVPAPPEKTIRRGLYRTPEELQAKQRRRPQVASRATTNTSISSTPRYSDSGNDVDVDVGLDLEEANSVVEPEVHPTSTNNHFPTTNDTPSSDEYLGTGDSNIVEQEESLVEARAVEEPSLLQADPVDLTAQEKRQKQRRRLGMLLLLFGLVVISIAIGIGVQQAQRSSENTTVITNSNATMTPTVSAAPSSSPSMAPTTYLNKFTETLLPTSTQLRLEDSDSPQSQAFAWFQVQNFSAYEPWRQQQLFALATFYYSFGGENWPFGLNDDWLDATRHECEWFSGAFGFFASDLFVETNGDENQELDNQAFVESNNDADVTDNITAICEGTPDELTCRFHILNIQLTLGLTGSDDGSPCSEQGEYQSLVLLQNIPPENFDARLPPELELLPSLRNLILVWNDINVPLTNLMPSELGQLPVLEIYQVSGSFSPSSIKVHGTIPTEVGLMSRLRWLNLNENALSGPLPSEIGSLTELYALDLSDNALSGTIPTEIGLLTGLGFLAFQQNNFVPPLPSELFLLTELESLKMDGTFFNESLPTEIQLLTNLEEFSIEGGFEGNSFSSALSLFPLSTSRIDLSESVLTGTIPSEIGLLTALTWLNLGDNFITGRIPSELGLCSNLWTIDLVGNMLTGTLPKSVGALNGFVASLYVDFGRNLLTGTIPHDFASTEFLKILDLHENALTGTIPQFVGTQSLELIQLDFSRNLLSGTIPTENGLMSSPYFSGGIIYANNLISGAIPSELGNIGFLNSLSLSNNELTGTIPSSLGLLDTTVVDLRNNKLKGPIPSELGSMDVVLLDLQNNELSGTIPSELARLSGYSGDGATAAPFVRMFLTNNSAISGTIPPELGEIAQNGTHGPLIDFRVDGTSVFGTIPEEQLCGCSCECDQEITSSATDGNSTLDSIVGLLPP